ncbi:MAG: HlyC/CorC family transporter [Planctomycetota bacterium]|nr:MAG: HlyC/CorC family transporter [Planctomycetota bacterium]
MLLVLLGALLGGLRTLLASPLRGSLLLSLPEERRKRWEERLERSEQLVAAAGMLRALCVFGAALLVFVDTEPLSWPWRLALWFGAALLVAMLHEAIPALVASGRGVGVVLLTLPLVRLLSLPLRPLTSLLRGIQRKLGAHPAGQRVAAIAAEMMEAASASGRLTELGERERLMIEHILELPETFASQVMTPRTELTAIPAQTTLIEALRTARKEGHSRILVIEKDLDHVVGLFYVKDVLLALDEQLDLKREVVREHMREPYFVPETTRVPALLEEMRKRRTHLAVVVDEYGGTAGVVTIEDILEEIVGEIWDEFEGVAASGPVQRVGPDEAVVEGRIFIADLNEAFGAALPETEDFDTVAGLMFDRFGRIPAKGERLEQDGLVLEVLDADDRRIRKVRVRRLEPAPAESDAA